MAPLMIDVQGTSLTSEDKDILNHPLVGGLILFSRNYQSPEQVTELVKQIRQAAGKDILIAVDHEGGRVQRFREQFSAIPAMADIWKQSNGDLELACQLAKHMGYLMAVEVLAVGIDISFAPVLDIEGISEVIGDRAFHQQPEKVTQLAGAFVDGMHLAGMKSTGKHFPGHGSVLEDSHFALPVDRRSKEQIFNLDMQPFEQLIQAGKVDALMPAHVIYPEIDEKAVGFSHYWLNSILREQLNFNGVIFSDDLTMEGAASIGGNIERAEAAWDAGCDMLLVCNSRAASVDIIDNARLNLMPERSARIKTMLKGASVSWQALDQQSEYQQARKILNQYF
jgi:beta-N-acetylhexosaminidase